MREKGEGRREEGGGRKEEGGGRREEGGGRRGREEKGGRREEGGGKLLTKAGIISYGKQEGGIISCFKIRQAIKRKGNLAHTQNYLVKVK